MGRPIGSMNREKPFNSALLIELRSNPHALRRIAAKLIERATEGELAAIQSFSRNFSPTWWVRVTSLWGPLTCLPFLHLPAVFGPRRGH